jgi:flagellar protein FliS
MWDSGGSVMLNNLSKAYMLTKILTATRNEVIVYLYEGAIGNLRRAVELIEEEQPGQAGTQIERAISIVVELSGNLNYSLNDTAQISLKLDGIYNYLIETLNLAAARNDVDSLRSCEGVLSILHDAWVQAGAMQAKAGERLEPIPQLRVSA